MKWQYYQPVFEYLAIFNDVEWPWAGHRYFAYDLVRNMKPKMIVELGTHKGTSFFSMCQAVKDGGLETKLVAVDTWKGDKHAGFYSDDVLREVKEIRKKYYSSIRPQLLRMTFDEAQVQFANKSISLLHIDGLHTYEAVKHDFDFWFEKVADDGIIMLHDVVEKSDDFGVYQLWDEIKKKYPNLEFVHSHGLGVLLLDRCLEKITNHEDIWQRYYDLRFQLDVQKFQNEQLLAQVNEQDKQIELRSQIALVETQIVSLEQDMHKIRSAKFYKVWRAYRYFKKRLFL